MALLGDPLPYNQPFAVSSSARPFCLYNVSRFSLQEVIVKDFRRRPKSLKLSKQLTSWPVISPTDLMTFLIQKLPGKGRNNIKSLLVHRQVLVDGHPVTRYNHPLQLGQEVTINWSLIRNNNQSSGLKIIYEDEAIIVIDKPAGLLSIASDNEKIFTAYHKITDYVRTENPENRVFIIHRLDRDTSGLMVFAKDEVIKHQLQNNWQSAVVDRAYIAVVEGRLDKQEGTIKSWLLETKTKLVYSSLTPGDGTEAITHYRVVQANKNYSMLEIRLETGRKNQIRVHMKDIGHPIIGDKKYGTRVNPISRLGLHAHILAFHHPVTREILCFETEAPHKFAQLFK